MAAAQARMELIARTFGETGVKELYQAFVDMNLDFFDREQSIKVNQQWMKISPEMIDGHFDVNIEVGVGTGSQEVKVQQLISMLQMTAPMIETNVVAKENLQALLKEIYLLMGYRDTTKYVGTPETNNVTTKQMQQMQQQMQQMQQQLQQAGQIITTLQADSQNKAAQIQLKDKEIMLDNNIEKMKIDLKEKELMLKFTEDTNMDEEDAAKLMLENKKIELDHEIKLRNAETNEAAILLNSLKGTGNDSQTG
jgi:hypothetical protein